LSALLGDDASLEPLKTTLIARTGGNPFFLEESTRALVEAKALVGERAAYRVTEAPGPIQIPATVQAVLAARIDRLPPEEKHVLQAASVVGKNVPLALLQGIADLPEDVLRRALTRLQTAEFLYETSSLPEIVYTISHALTHEVAYASLAEDRQRALHARIIAVIEALYPDRLTQHLERLGHHAFQGELWEQAVQYLRQAGAKAVDRSANREAVAFFEQALAALGRLPERVGWAEEAIDLRFYLRSPLIALGDFKRLLDSLLGAEKLSETLGDQRRLGQVSAYLTQLYILMGDQDRAIRSGQRALALAEVIGELSVQVVANNCLGDTYFSLGDYPRSMELHARNTKLLQGDLIRERFGLAGLPAVFSRSWLAWSLAELGRFTEGIAYGEEATRIAEAVDHPYSRIFADFGIGGLYLRQGSFDKALTPLEHGLTLCQATGIRILFPYIGGLLGSAYAFSGRLSEAVPLLEQAVQAFVSMNVMMGRSLLVSFLSEVYLLAGRVDDAVELAGRALDLSRAHHERGWEAWSLKLLGDIACQARVLDVDQASASYGQALALASELGMRPLVAHCHFGLGRLHRRRGSRVEADEHVRTATAMFHGMDMRFWAEQAAAQPGEFRASDPTIRSSRQPDGEHPALTTGPGVPALLIVSTERPDLYDYFRQRIEAEATGHVIVNRRFGERRRRSQGREPERRQADRRLRPGIDPELKRLGFAIVNRRVPLEGSDVGPRAGQP
jgi:tetratricopeptide (TPR) repeat protein